MVIAAVNLLENNPHPSEQDIRKGLAGNLCRCTGYMKIFESVVRACEGYPATEPRINGRPNR
jgi:carbon-monoxide dehydrogenase small subunit